MNFLKNIPAQWSVSISRTLLTIRWFRNARHKTISYMPPLLTFAKSSNAYSILSKLVNNTFLPALKLLFLLPLLSQLLLMLMPWTWHASSLLLKKRNTTRLKAYIFTLVKLVTKLFFALSSQPIDMLKPFKTPRTFQLPSLLQKLLRTWDKNNLSARMRSGTKAKCF